MNNHINYRKIYKESFLVFKKYKLLRIFGISQVGVLILFLISSYFVLSLFKAEFTLYQSNAILMSTYYSSLAIFFLFITLLFLVTKNWANAALIKSTESVILKNPVSIHISSYYGKKCLINLTLLDLIIWPYYIMFSLLVNSVSLYFSILFPILETAFYVTSILINIVFFIAAFLIVLFSSRSIVLDNLPVIKSIRLGFNFILVNTTNILTLIIVNLSVLSPFLLVAALVFTLSELLSLYFLNLNQMLSLFFYSFGISLLLLLILTSWIFYGSFRVFTTSVWTRFYLEHPYRKVLLKRKYYS